MSDQLTQEDLIEQMLSTSKSLGRQIGLRKAESKALYESRETLLQIFESSPDAITVSDIAGIITDCNAATVKLHGYKSKEELVGQSGFMLIAPKDRLRAVETLKDMLERGPAKNMEFTCLKKDGAEFEVEFSASIIRNADGEPTSFVIISKDITERKKYVETLRRNEEELRLLIENTKDSIFWADPETGAIINCNKSAEKLLGMAKEELIGRHVSILYPPENKERVSAGFLKYAARHSGAEIQPDVETQIVTKSGRIIPAHVSSSMITISGKPAIQGILRDITEIKEEQLEKEALINQLNHSQKMEAVGLLAGGMAHDFKNIISVIDGYAQLALMNMKQDDVNRENVDRILKSVERAQRLTLRLLTFARDERANIEPASISGIIAELADMARGGIPKNIAIETKLPESDLCVLADANLLLQALLNICFNAAEAMPDGGRLTISASAAPHDGELAKRQPGFDQEHSILIQISDSGHGIPDGIKDKIFEPLFTTKDRDKGSGLGLSVSLGIVKSHNGAIDISSKAGEGTSVNIYLPATDRECQ
ncbi:MAG: PAS domain S-box protein [bacterium]